MLIKLNNGIELNPISAIGEKRYVHGASRDTITFVFSAETSLDEMDALFTSENCAKIIICEGESEYIHNGYTIRAELKREPVEVTPATESTDAVYENRVTVSMAQMTYMESQLAEQAIIINSLLNGEE
jgi:hypothetical protein